MSAALIIVSVAAVIGWALNIRLSWVLWQSEELIEEARSIRQIRSELATRVPTTSAPFKRRGRPHGTLGETSSKVLEVIGEMPLKHADIARATGLMNGTVNAKISSLIRGGYIRHNGYGYVRVSK